MGPNLTGLVSLSEGELGHGHAQGEGYTRTRGEDGHLHTKERDLRGNQPCRHLDLGLPASRTIRKSISVV